MRWREASNLQEYTFNRQIKEKGDRSRGRQTLLLQCILVDATRAHNNFIALLVSLAPRKCL